MADFWGNWLNILLIFIGAWHLKEHETITAHYHRDWQMKVPPLIPVFPRGCPLYVRGFQEAINAIAQRPMNAINAQILGIIVKRTAR